MLPSGEVVYPAASTVVMVGARIGEGPLAAKGVEGIQVALQGVRHSSWSRFVESCLVAHRADRWRPSPAVHERHNVDGQAASQ